MKVNANNILLIVLFLVIGCEYHKDKLIVQNESNGNACYLPLVLGKDNKGFYEVSAGGEIKPNGYDHPIIRVPINRSIDKQASDGKLYIVFFNCDDREYVYKNIPHIVFDKRVTVQTFSRKELDSLGWAVKFNGNISPMPNR